MKLFYICWKMVFKSTKQTRFFSFLSFLGTIHQPKIIGGGYRAPPGCKKEYDGDGETFVWIWCWSWNQHILCYFLFDLLIDFFDESLFSVWYLEICKYLGTNTSRHHLLSTSEAVFEGFSFSFSHYFWIPTTKQFFAIFG